MVMSDEQYQEMLKRAKERLPMTEEKSRFEIPRAMVQVQGRQTIIRNFQEIAKLLRREPQHLAKYLFKELAVPGSSVSGQELSLQGKFGSDFINRKIESYIKEFVLCEKCGKPDTNLNKVDRYWSIKCEACGAKKPARSI
jgi:translation initiation factor 2 subunit 2